MDQVSQTNQRESQSKTHHWGSKVFLLSLILIALNFNIALARPTERNFSIPLSLSALRDQRSQSLEKMLANFSPADAARGIVVASPSRHHPDYYHHWVRDAALAYDVALQIYSDTNNGGLRSRLRDFSFDYVYLNQRMQNDSRASAGLGEPRFYPDGSPLPDSIKWGRPQNDSPALRAINLVMLYQTVVRENWIERNQFLPLIYDSQFPSNSILKKDLEYVAGHWQESSFDLWEEVRGSHFFTLIVQRKALLMGADLAASLQDPGAAFYYRTEAEKIKAALSQFWSPNSGYILASKFEGYAGQSRESRLDTAVLFGALAGDAGDGFMAPYDDRVLATLQRLRDVFGSLYNINRNAALGEALGRYPEDTYDGYTTDSIGNPWFIGTQAGAEIYFRTYLNIKGVGRLNINSINIHFYQSLFNGAANLYEGLQLTEKDALFQRIAHNLRIEGDRMLARTLYHRGDDGSLSEQMNRNTGFMQGAENLTWSHASYLSAFYWRELAFQK